MTTSCLFSELDPFTGEIPFRNNLLETITSNLKLVCLLYDRVIVNSNVLLGHPLCLPAFQKLKPFVQTGVLWTTNGKPQEGMEAFLLMQARRVLRDANPKQAEQIEKMLDIWLSLAPAQWSMTRNAGRQVTSATHNILHNLQSLHLFASSGKQALHRMLNATHQMQADQRFAREELFVLLGNMRGVLHHKDMAQMAMVVQGEYISQGTQHKGEETISLYGGNFAQRMYRQQHLFSAGMPRLDFYTQASISQALQTVGYPYQRILSLPTDGLFEFSQSPEWKHWRQTVLTLQAQAKPPIFPPRLQRFFTHPKIHIGWNGILTPDAPLSAQLLAQNPWLLSSLATLGNLTQEKDKTHVTTHPTLNLSSPSTLSWLENGVLHHTNLSHKEASLLMMLAFFGTDGAPLDVLCQMDMEVNMTKDQIPQWQAWQDESPEAQAAQLNRLNVLKHRLNNRLRVSTLQIMVSKRKSLWHLHHQGKPAELTVTGTTWTRLDKQSTPVTNLPDANPESLTPRQRQAFQSLLQHAPHFVSARLLAEAIGKPDTETKKISDMIYRMNKQLAGSFQITRNHKGEYGLLPANPQD